MIRNLKLLGLALAAICSLSVMVASPAIAEFTAPNGATITGSEAEVTKFTDTDQTVTCADVSYHATASTGSFTHITLSPRYTECKTNLGTHATFTGFGHHTADAGKPKCGYTISATGTFALECEPGGEVTTDAGPCVIHIPPQHIASGVTFTTGLQAGSVHDLLLHFDIQGITSNHTDGFLCPFGSSGHGTAGVLEGTVTLTAEINGVPAHLTHG